VFQTATKEKKKQKLAKPPKAKIAKNFQTLSQSYAKAY
jgi:hypothetical protein